MNRNILKLLLSAAFVMCCTFSALAQLGTPPNDEIWYTTTDGKVCNPLYTDAFDATIISNTYPENGHGTIKFDGDVTSIGPQAFSERSALTSISIPNSVTSIRGNAFFRCNNLISISIPNSVTSIGANAFWECYSLTSISIPNSVTSIWEHAFYSCSGLTSITIPSSMTNIGESVFQNCFRLTSITIPNSVTSIGRDAFRCCYGLTSISIPNSVTSIGEGAFCGSGLTSITIPSSVTSIGEGAFQDCSGLTSVTIPNSVTSIGEGTFFFCSGLTSITIPSSVTSIGANAFYSCKGLTSVTIPSSVTSIGEYAFYSCDNLHDVLYLGNNNYNYECFGYFFGPKPTAYVSDDVAESSGTWCNCPALPWRSGEGDGTEDNPYQIATLENLMRFTSNVNSGAVSACAVLVADITMNTGVLDSNGNLSSEAFEPWIPIGGWGNNGYSGEFDGNGHTISGLYFNDETTSAVGLFGMANNSGNVTARIHDLGVKDSYFRGKSHVGGICGDFANGRMENCWNAATVQSVENTAGGLVGSCWIYSTLSGCYNIGKVVEGTNCGGICGSVAKNVNGFISVSNCVSLEGKCSVAYNLYDDAEIDNVHIKNAAAFTSGEVCWILNGNCRSAAWRQHLRTDDYPMVTGDYVVYKDGNVFRNETVCEMAEDHLHSFEESVIQQPSGTYINCWHCTECGNNYKLDDKTNELPKIEFTEPSAGDGSQANPYQIATLGNLLWFANHVNTGNASVCAILTADITMNASVLKSSGYSNGEGFVDWVPIGGHGKDFGGDFDGNGHTISGLYLKNTGMNNMGLFGKAVNNAHIHDLGISDSYFYGKDHVGGICGDFASGQIENCWNGATIDAKDWNAGGISGSCWIYASIKDCYNIGRIVTNYDNPSYGGICGAVYENTGVDYTISNCYTLQGKCSKVYGSLDNGCPASKINHSFVKNDDAFASGEVCYQLNHGVTNGSQKWYQTLETDEFPVLNNSHNTVFFGYDGDVLKYSNTPITVGAIHRNICDATCSVGYTMECWEDTRSRRFYAEEACATELNAAYVVTYSPVTTVPEYGCSLAAWRWEMKDEPVTYDGVTFINALEKRYPESASYDYGEYVWFIVKDSTARNVRLKWHLNKNTFNGELYYKINDGIETKIDVSGNMWVQNLPDLKQDDIVTVYYRINSMWDITLNSPLIWTMSLEYCPGHSPELVMGILPTETTEGRYGYYRCTKCEKNYKDESCSEELTDMTDLNVPEANNNEIWYTTIDDKQIEHRVNYKENVYSRGLGKIVFADGVTEIANDAFNRNKTLKSIFIPSSVTKIGNSSFWECSAWESVFFASLPNVDQHAFGNCYKLSTKVFDLTDSDKPFIGTSLDNYPSAGFTEAHYHGTLEPNQWGTITLPFVPSSHQGIVFFSIDNVDAANGTLTLSIAENIEAGMPYLFRNQTDNAGFTLTASASSVPVNITASEQTVGDFALKGTFQASELTGTGLYKQQGGEFVHTNSLSIDPFRAYLKDNDGSAVGRIVINCDGVLVTITKQDDSTITLYGVKEVEFVEENGMPSVRVTYKDDSTKTYDNPKKVEFGK